MPLVRTQPVKPANVILPEWEEMTVIFRLEGGGIRAEDGIRYGTLAVHPSLGNDEPPVTVTHLPTKIPIFQADSAEDGISLAEKLWLRCADAFKRRGEDIDRGKLTADDMAWIKRCQQARKVTA